MNGHREYFPAYDEQTDDLRNDPQYEAISNQRYQEWGESIAAIPADHVDAITRHWSKAFDALADSLEQSPF